VKKYRTVFIGNRPSILSSLIQHPQIELVHTFVIKWSLIPEDRCASDPVTLCGPNDAGMILDFLRSDKYDICVSAGCPYILPIRALPSGNVYINSHPSALPFGKGIHPINECILSNHQKAGSTLHYLSDELDAGDIIHQETFDVTDDIDLDLLYSFIFEVEREVFDEGLRMVLAADLKYKGTPQQGEGTYYSRKLHDQNADVRSIGTYDFLKKVRSFSSNSLGVHITLTGKEIHVFMASLLFNAFFNKRFETAAAGDVIISNDKFILVKLIDGIVRIDKWIVL